MIDNNKTFEKYLSGQMNETERKLFEAELASSIQLKDDFESYKKVIKLVDTTKNIELNPQYAQSIISTFRNKTNIKRKKSIVLKYGYAFVIIFTVVFSYFILSIFNGLKQVPDEMLTDYNNDATNYLSAELYSDIENEFDENTMVTIDSIYKNKLSENVTEAVNDNTIDELPGSISLNELDKYLSNKDIEQIYAELSNKEILKR